MSDVTLDSVFVMLCDWRGHCVWSTRASPYWKTGDLAWKNLDDESTEEARALFSRVVTLREQQLLEVVNQQGERFRCWLWPLNSPETAVCVLGMRVPSELSRLTERELECLELLAQGTETREIARQLQVSLSTVHTHMKRAREKLGIPNVESLISFAARYCYPSYQPLVRHQA
jgi:DNA-binding CsgD family transcriptional regulator